MAARVDGSIAERKLTLLEADYVATVNAKPAAEAVGTADGTAGLQEEVEAFRRARVLGGQGEGPAAAGAVGAAGVGVAEDEEWEQFESGGDAPPQEQRRCDEGMTAEKAELIKKIAQGIQIKVPEWAQRIPDDAWLCQLKERLSSTDEVFADEDRGTDQNRNDDQNKSKKKKKNRNKSKKKKKKADQGAPAQEVGSAGDHEESSANGRTSS